MFERHETDISYPAATEQKQTAPEVQAAVEQTTDHENHKNDVYHTVAAWGLTATLNIIPEQVRKGSENGGCWRIYPICNAVALRNQKHLFWLEDRSYPCEMVLILVATTTLIHWYCVLRLFSQPKWRNKYLSQTMIATFITLVALGGIIQDSATVFLRVLPVVIDVYASTCLARDYLDG
ncbi:hypothetical protein ACQKWADRAFT_280614 [Trichoderma austrokoningii]